MTPLPARPNFSSPLLNYPSKIQANVDPAFTCLVWQKLLDQNPNFFYGYALCLRLKDQIIAFNYLVDQHQKMLVAQREGGIDGFSSSSSSSFLQQQQLMQLTQIQNMYSQKAAAAAGAVDTPSVEVGTGAKAVLSTGVADPVMALTAAAARNSPHPIMIPGGPDEEPLSLDPNSLGSGGLDGKSILTPMVNAVTAAAATAAIANGAAAKRSKNPAHFFPLTPKK